VPADQPTETEAKEDLDRFIAAMVEIREGSHGTEKPKGAP
jgi:glycine cleavage system protein P-like pyridoxal-binding family